jgi:hypothetical protein
MRSIAVQQGEFLFYMKCPVFNMGNSLILGGEYPDVQLPGFAVIKKIR